MLEKKSRSDNDLVDSYYSCALFKKYYQYNLWLGSLGEYKNIKYCRKYIQKYIGYCINFFLFKCVSLSFATLLYKSPRFIKFIESGFFKYLDYHFLLLFHYNCFTFDLEGKKNIKGFIRLYYENNLKKRVEKDLFLLVIDVLNDIILNTLIADLKETLKYDLKVVNVSTKRMEKAFIRFPVKNCHNHNKEIQYLIESFELSGGYISSHHNIGLYKDSSAFF